MFTVKELSVIIPVYNAEHFLPRCLDSILCRPFESNAIEAVIHFAAHSQVGESVSKPLLYFDNNVHGTGVLLSALVRRRVELVVFSSSAAVYGEPARMPLQETDPARPTNPYGETKLTVARLGIGTKAIRTASETER